MPLAVNKMTKDQLRQHVLMLAMELTQLGKEIKNLKEENVLLKGCLDKLMFDADVVNVKIHGELGDYCYVRSDKKFKLNVKD